MDFTFWLSLFVFIVVATVMLEVALGVRKLGHLRDSSPSFGEHAPMVSIVVPALNEARTIEPALRSLLNLDYPNMEVIAVNDRSTDATPAILDHIAATNPKLRVVHITTLPSGWLGKNHALYRGAQLATGDYILFTDADVIFETTSLGRAIAYCERHTLDHLTILADVVARTQLLSMLILSFSINFLARFKPWKVRSSRKHYVGAGVFNLVRKTAYLKAGGHAAIPLAVLDDVTLGRLIKESGGLQDALFGQGLVAVEWYRSTRELANGMKKNIFAAFDYRLSQLMIVTLLMFFLRIWPWIGLIATDDTTWALNAATVLVQLAMYVDMLRASSWSYRCLVFAPVVALVELVIWWRGSMWTLMRGGIEWRGTRYSLKELRQAHD